MVQVLCIWFPSLEKAILSGTENHLGLIIEAEASNYLFRMCPWQTDIAVPIESPSITLGQVNQLERFLAVTD